MVHGASREALHFVSQWPSVALISEASVRNLAACLFTRLPRTRIRLVFPVRLVQAI
jgi:hypothetical protein